MPSAKNNSAEMSFFDHLEALRWHILRSVMAIGIIAVLVFLVPQIVFTKLIFGLRSQDFFTYKFFCWASSLNLGDTFCIGKFSIAKHHRSRAANDAGVAYAGLGFSFSVYVVGVVALC